MGRNEKAFDKYKAALRLCAPRMNHWIYSHADTGTALRKLGVGGGPRTFSTGSLLNELLHWGS